MRSFTINEAKEGQMATWSLSEKAQKVYSDTDPLNVYEREGKYYICGAFGEYDDLTLEELEKTLESFAMTTNLYYVIANGYDMIVSVDYKGNVRVLDDMYFLYLRKQEDEDKDKKAVIEFLQEIEDDSSWELQEDVLITDDFPIEDWLGDDVEIFVHIEKTL